MGFTRRRRSIEPRWVSEYIAMEYPDAEVRPRVPLGPVPESMIEELGPYRAARRYRPWRPEVDALVILPDRLILIEAKIFKVMDGLSKLPTYKALVPSTAELAVHAGKPVEMRLLVVRKVPWVVEAARALGVEVVEWAPDWVRAVWEERDKYWTKPYVAERERRRERLERMEREEKERP